jgi:malate/lactate dehydrogenase
LPSGGSHSASFARPSGMTCDSRIGMVAARLAEVVLRDERAVVPVGSHNARYDVTVSLPSVVDRSGVNDGRKSRMMRRTRSSAASRS